MSIGPPSLFYSQLANTRMLDADGRPVWQWSQFFRNIPIPTLFQAQATVNTTINVQNVYTDLVGMSLTATFYGGANLIMVALAVVTDVANSDYDIALCDGNNNILQTFYSKNPFAAVGSTLAFTWADFGRAGNFTYKLRARVRQAAASIAFGTPDLMQVLRLQGGQ